MFEPLVVVYLGDGRHGLGLVRVIDQQLRRSVHVLSTPPDDLEALLSNTTIDAIVCGESLDGTELQAVVNTLSQSNRRLPLFDMTGSIAAIPEELDVHYLAPDSDPETAGEMLVRTTLSADYDWGSADVTRFPGTYFAVDSAWTITDWDPGVTEWAVESPTDVIGDRLFEVFPSWENTGLGSALIDHLGADQPFIEKVTYEPGEKRFQIHIIPLESGGLECYLRTIGSTADLDHATQFDIERFENTLDRITDAFFALDREDRFIFLNSKAESILEVDADEVIGVRFWDAFPAAMTTSFYHEFNEAMQSQDPTSFEERYRPTDSWLEVNAYPSDDGLSVFLKDITEQVRLQQRLEDLHEVTRDLIVAETDEAIARETVRAAEGILDFQIAAVWRFDQRSKRLQPIAWSDVIDDDDLQDHGPESEFIWDVYETGEHRRLGFVPATTTTSHHPGRVTSELLVPVGEYGVIAAYSDERDAFDETDVELFRLLASTVESAFARTRRERQLARQNERLDDFASIVSHDLRNPLSVASANLELARELEDPGEQLDTIESALYRMDDLIEDLLERARGDQELEREHLSLGELAERAWKTVDSADATLQVDAEAEFTADPGRIIQLFENLFRNAIEHGGGDVTVMVGPHDDGFYVADDGPGIPAENRSSIFDRGVSYSEEGTGYGLAIVGDVVGSHGWTIDVTESMDGGARFEIGNVRSMTSVTEARQG